MLTVQFANIAILSMLLYNKLDVSLTNLYAINKLIPTTIKNNSATLYSNFWVFIFFKILTANRENANIFIRE